MERTISAIGAEHGLSADTLRYYERLGLVRPAGRSAAGYRLYDDEAAERLEFIKGGKQMGLRLSDIKELLEVRDRGLCPCGHTQELVRRRLAEVEAEIAQLRATRRQLLGLQRCGAECTDTAEVWPCALGIEKGGA